MRVLEQYALYLLRWQMSTPILALVIAKGKWKSMDWKGVVLGNLIGGLIFFWVDRWILCR